MGIKTKNYKDYQKYVDHQKEKTLDEVRRKKWLGEEWEVKVRGFEEIFGANKDLLASCKKALCLGARTGQEVHVLREMGIDALGIDLVPCEPLVVAGDIHALAYEDQSMDLVFSNILDHSLNPQKFASEMERVLRPGGIIFLQLYVGPAFSVDEYAVIEVSSIESDVVPLFKQCEVVTLKHIPLNFACMNRELLLRKNQWIVSQ